MIFSIFLTVLFLFMVFYSLVFVKYSVVRVALIFLYSVPVFFIWNPDYTTIIANYFGIGRGLDFFLIIFSVAIVNALVFVARHINDQHQQITKLARYLSLRDATPAKNQPLRNP